ncbi:MAG: pyrroloquinoline-quinone synthase PqqC [Trueperaceae bacterium]|nr:pyrroloquinoline-quinone synthase PqqC [Trueperaceae bacterium]
MTDTPTKGGLEARLHDVLERRYHHLHPFNQAMHAGRLTPEQLRQWVANRFYYQQNIPVKDALLLSKLPTEYRREWIGRIHTHDGRSAEEGGLETWLRLAEATGLDRKPVLDNSMVFPGVRFAVDAYVGFVRDQPWLDGVASSLTELFAPRIMKTRTGAFLEHYDWIESDGLQYFRDRQTQAPREAEQALAIVQRHATTPELQERMVAALHFKCDVLWALLDALDYNVPGSDVLS